METVSCGCTVVGIRERIDNLIKRKLGTKTVFMNETMKYDITWNGTYYCGHDKKSLGARVMRDQYPHTHEDG